MTLDWAHPYMSPKPVAWSPNILVQVYPSNVTWVIASGKRLTDAEQGT